VSSRWSGWLTLKPTWRRWIALAVLVVVSEWLSDLVCTWVPLRYCSIWYIVIF
jgi:hypothetical protein